LEAVGPDTKPFGFTVGAMHDMDGAPLTEPRTPQMRFTLQLDNQVPAYTILRRSVDLSPRD
jgi:putative protease